MDYFKVLGIEPTTDKSAIKRAYNRAWGDALGDGEKMKVLNEAQDLALAYADNGGEVSIGTSENEMTSDAAWPHHEKNQELDKEIAVTPAVEEQVVELDAISDNDSHETPTRDAWDVYYDDEVESDGEPRRRPRRHRFQPRRLIFSGIGLVIFLLVRSAFDDVEPAEEIRQETFNGFPVVINEHQANPPFETQEELDEAINDLLEELRAIGTRDEPFETLYDTVWELLVDIEMALLTTELWRENPDLVDEVETQVLWILDVLVDYGRDISIEFLEYLHADLEYLYEMINQAD